MAKFHDTLAAWGTAVRPAAIVDAVNAHGISGIMIEEHAPVLVRES